MFLSIFKPKQTRKSPFWRQTLPVCVLYKEVFCLQYTPHTHQAALRGEALQVQVLWQAFRVPCCPRQPRPTLTQGGWLLLWHLWENLRRSRRLLLPREVSWRLLALWEFEDNVFVFLSWYFLCMAVSCEKMIVILRWETEWWNWPISRIYQVY